MHSCTHFFYFFSSTLFRVGGACSLILGVNTLYKLTHPCKYRLLFDRGWLLIYLCFRLGLPINQLIRQQDDHERASVGLFASPTFGPRSVCMLGKGCSTYSRAGSQIVFPGVVPYWIPC